MESNDTEAPGFAALGLSEPVLRALASVGYEAPSPIQAATIPVVLERTGFPTGEINVTSVPDLTFQIHDRDGTLWNVTANALSGTVTGSRADAEKVPNELSVRRFLLRLHTAHGYPSSGGIRWWWAVIVDAMAFVMVFWGLSGLLMWWQLKATRKLGIVLVGLSLVGAIYLAMGMHSAMTGG